MPKKRPKAGEEWRLKSDPTKRVRVLWAEEDYVMLAGDHFKRGESGKMVDTFLAYYERCTPRSDA